MDISIVLAQMYGGILVLVGVSMLNRKYVRSVFDALAQNHALMWVTGFVTFYIGLVSVALYHAWPSNWHAFVTLAGWLTLLKGAVLTLLPKASIAFYRKTLNQALPAAGIVAIAIGLYLLYLSLAA